MDFPRLSLREKEKEYSVQQRVEAVFSFGNISGIIKALEALLEPMYLSQIGCPPRGERAYHSAASRLPLRADVK